MQTKCFISSNHERQFTYLLQPIRTIRMQPTEQPKSKLTLTTKILKSRYTFLGHYNKMNASENYDQQQVSSIRKVHLGVKNTTVEKINT